MWKPAWLAPSRGTAKKESSRRMADVGAASGRPLRLMILVDKFDYHGSFINGPARYFSWVAERFDPARVDATVCTLRGRGQSDSVFKECGIDVHYFDFGKYDPFALFRIVSLIRKNQIDVLHLTGYGAMTFGRIAAAITGRPAILQEHWVDPEMGIGHRIINKLMAPFPAVPVAISEYSKRFLIAKKSIPEEEIVVIHNGIPLGPFHDADAESGLAKRREFGFAPESIVVGVVGMMHENKGHAYFIEAAAIVAEKNPNVKFVLVGDGELRQTLEAQAKSLDFGERLTFLGHQGEMPALLQMLDIYVMSSFSETAPLSLLEAMAAGRPIVTTDCGGPMEMVEEGETARIVAPRDAVALAGRILELANDPSERARLGANAREESRRFDIDNTVEMLQQLYEKKLRQGQQTDTQA
jgi:glycosyltransferase involved in cell wall biosynthesis